MTTRNPLPSLAAALFLLFLVGVLLIASAAAAAAATPPASAQAPSSAVRLRRFVLLAGVDDGGPTRTKLRYAASDARAIGHVLQTLGGVAPEDIVFVSTANRSAFDTAFGEIEQRLRAGTTPGVRRELLVYYSGHSDEDGLLIGRDRVGYDELRTRVQRASADLRVVILDSCASGAFTRRKGGVKRAPFLLDASSDMRGHAFLTSSAADERAQESDRISASYFTYYLVSGLRGAADMNQDRRVTLQEAYQFASQETLARTERSQAGPQHAAYEFDLAGTGDMVVTDVRGTQSGLVLSPELGGRITVREANGALVAELRKPAGNTIELGLDPGAYVVAMDSGTTIFQATVSLAAGKHTPLAAAAFHAAGPRELAVARGDDGPALAGEPAATATATASPPPMSEPTSYKLTFFPTASDKRADVKGFSFGFVADRSQRVHGLQLALAWAQTDVDLVALQLSVGANLVRGNFEGAQITAGLNIVRGTGRGLQLVGGSNVVEGTFTGAQIAGASNATTGFNKGFQLAGGINWVGSGSGLQIAGGANVSTKDFTGLQLSTINYADSVDGVQFGVANVAPTSASGLRFGVVNVGGTTRGFSFGVVNVAKHEDGESFALINVVGNGIHDVSLFASDVLATNVGFKLGGRHLYTNIMAGYQGGDEVAAGPERFTNGTKRFGLGFGLGWRFPIDRGLLKFAELEADSMQIRPVWHWIDDAPTVNSLRLQAGIRLAPYVTLLAGAGVNVAIATDGRDLDLGLDVAQSVQHSGAATVRIYPGLLLGLQI